MTSASALILLQDGFTNGLIYALLAISILLIFLVTRVLWLPAGEIVVFSALTLAAISQGRTPGTMWLLIGLGTATAVVDTWRCWQSRQWDGWPLKMLAALGLPALGFALVSYFLPGRPSLLTQVVLTLLLIVPLGPFTYRLAFQPIANASTLVLLFVSVAVHYALTGLGLVFFGPDGFRTRPFYPGRFDIGVTRVSWQLVIVLIVALATIVALWLFFNRSMWGKALRATAVNRLGAKLVGLQVEKSGALAFTISALISALSGILIGPVTTLYYDSGFALGLRGFIGVVLAGMASFPMAALGALGVGLVEVFATFYASVYRDVIAFSLLIPILLWRSLSDKSPHVAEDEE